MFFPKKKNPIQYAEIAILGLAFILPERRVLYFVKVGAKCCAINNMYMLTVQIYTHFKQFCTVVCTEMHTFTSSFSNSVFGMFTIMEWTVVQHTKKLYFLRIINLSFCICAMWKPAHRIYYFYVVYFTIYTITGSFRVYGSIP